MNVYLMMMIMVIDELVWKEDMVEAEKDGEGDWEECSDEDEDDDEDEGEEAPDLVDITSSKKKVGKESKKASEASGTIYLSSSNPYSL